MPYDSEDEKIEEFAHLDEIIHLEDLLLFVHLHIIQSAENKSTDYKTSSSKD